MSSEFRRAQDCVRRARLALMAILMLLPIAFAIGRATAPGVVTVRQAEAKAEPRDLPAGLKRFHDATQGATCWSLDGRDVLSCLPDQWLLTARLDDMP